MDNAVCVYRVLFGSSQRRAYRKIIQKAGLRQGDPLSPYLFIFCMELLSRRLVRLQREGLIEGLKLSRRSTKINHLFFANDALFFLKADIANFGRLKATLDEFCRISEEIVSLPKSYVIFSRNAKRQMKRTLRQIIGVADKDKLGVYLGCPTEVDGGPVEGSFYPTHQKGF